MARNSIQFQKGLTLNEFCRRKAVMSGLNKVKMSAFGDYQGDIIDQRDIENESSGSRQT